jgi:hypothetical protein
MNDNVVFFEKTLTFWDFIENGTGADEEHQHEQKKIVFFMQFQHH